MVKLAYRAGADAMTVLAMRMLLTLPIFVALGLWSNRRAALPISRKQWLQMAGLGFLGYYVSSLVNFLGLQYITVGLERVVLYSYPVLVMLGAAIFLKKKPRPAAMVAAVVAWLGIAVAFLGEMETNMDAGALVALGAALVFLSALTYAAFILLSGQLVTSVGSTRFTAVVVGFSCVFILIHYALQRPVGDLFLGSKELWGLGAMLAVFGTVLPSLLMGVGLRRAGAQRFAVIGSVGPVFTLFLAWLLLGEELHLAQAIGFCLSVCGGVGVSLLKQ
jgi:drug/metabolite transporter (DMT)-like permease